jgi:hypothetical protein
MDHYYQLPLQAFSEFSFDDLCKLHYSSFIMMDQSVRDIFDNDPRYEIVRKIESSMWRWSMSREQWNEVVDAHERIRNFRFVDNPDFDIRLDYTTSTNEFGRAKFTRMFIDGVFAILVYYKRQHVMTISFSILKDRTLLVQQIQSVKRTGNRWLYKLPKNRVEFVIDLFIKNFPAYQLYLIDGKYLIQRLLRNYERLLGLARATLAEDQRRLDKCNETEKEDILRDLRNGNENCESLIRTIAHLEADKDRLVSFYRNIGRFRFGLKTIERFGMPHYIVET